MKNQLTRKVGFEGTPKLDPCWKSQPVIWKVKYGVEIRIERVTKDISHSWVRISHGLNKLVTDLKDKEYDENEQETSERRRKYLRLQAEPRLKQNREDLPLLAHLQGLCLWIDFVPRAQFDQAYPVAKGQNTLLRHGQLLREEDGAIVFLRLNDDLRNKF